MDKQPFGFLEGLFGVSLGRWSEEKLKYSFGFLLVESAFLHLLVLHSWFVASALHSLDSDIL